MPAVDKVAEAREARRRRILENSGKRLEKITGRNAEEFERGKVQSSLNQLFLKFQLEITHPIPIRHSLIQLQLENHSPTFRCCCRQSTDHLSRPGRRTHSNGTIATKAAQPIWLSWSVPCDGRREYGANHADTVVQHEHGISGRLFFSPAATGTRGSPRQLGSETNQDTHSHRLCRSRGLLHVPHPPCAFVIRQRVAEPTALGDGGVVSAEVLQQIKSETQRNHPRPDPVQRTTTPSRPGPKNARDAAQNNPGLFRVHVYIRSLTLLLRLRRKQLMMTIQYTQWTYQLECLLFNP